MMAMSEERPGDRTVSVKTAALSAVLGLVVLLAAGAVAGAIAGWAKSPENWGEALLAMAGALAVGGFALFALLRLRPRAGWDEPMSPRTRQANNLLLLSGLLGAVIGVALSISVITQDGPFALFTNSPISLAVVLPVLAVWLIAVPLISLKWHRSVDEHEAQAYRSGGLAGLYVYAFLTPAWWLAWRGGLVPEPNAMLIFLGVMGIWCLGWFWRRYN